MVYEGALYWDKQAIVIVSLLDYFMAELGCKLFPISDVSATSSRVLASIKF